ncbi:hypothetical protein [Pseudomonas amygdali]|uniref:hypothetical protein n=1 Tax=Pseudomonas amygdali TaxID=47877 RepID=UPI002E2730E4
MARLQTPWKHGLKRPRYSARFHTARVDSGLPSLEEIDLKLPIAKGSNRPILLKKSAMVSTAEKYASELEIFALSRGCRVKISRRCAQKRYFQQ